LSRDIFVDANDKMMNFCSGGPGLMPSYEQPFPSAFDQRQQQVSHFIASPSAYYPHDISTGSVAAVGSWDIYRGGYPINFRSGAPPQAFHLPVEQPLPPARLVPAGLPIRSHHLRANHSKRRQTPAAPYSAPAVTNLAQRQARRVGGGGSNNSSSNGNINTSALTRRPQTVVPIQPSTFPQQLHMMAEETRPVDSVPFYDGTGTLDDLQNFSNSQRYEPELTVRGFHVCGVIRRREGAFAVVVDGGVPFGSNHVVPA
jgi:hypothetical protein